MIRNCSLRDEHKLGAIISQIKMIRSNAACESFILVEGVTDKILLSKLIDRTKCEIIPCEGKRGVIEAINKTEQLALKGIIGIYDKDYDVFIGKNYEKSNLFATDANDIECMMMQTEAYSKFENKYADHTKLVAFKENKKTDLYSYIRNISAQIGSVRLVNTKAGRRLSLNFNSMNLENYISEALDFNLDAYLNDIVTAARKEQDIELVKEDTQEYLASEVNSWNLSRGHDLSEIIAVLFSDRKTMGIGNTDAKYFRKGKVESNLRDLYSSEDFMSTKLYGKICGWIKSNSRYCIFKG